ncbi:MAG TPA: ABC transporter permease [Candidatus Saccharimonadales bacterium]|nr:ABC transporter permease [Candidatus Saccharimonadales bacterium]
MTPTLKAEFRKLLTVRSTYFLGLIGLIIAGGICFYAGFSDHPAATATSLADTIDFIPTIAALFAGIVLLLQFGHEYRYGTIIYTLTASRSRSQVLLSKIVVAAFYILFYSLLMMVVCFGLVHAGLLIGGNTLPHQDINYLSYVAKTVAYDECYALTALLFVSLIRNMQASFVAFFIIPGTLEGLLSLVLKSHSVYMPFLALAQIIVSPTDKSIPSTGSLSPLRGLLVFLAYFLVAWAISWYLFLRRDAT